MTYDLTRSQSSIFSVILNSPNEEVAARVKSYHHYQMSDTCYLLSSDEISADIAIKIGLKGDNRVQDALGIVFRLNGAYSGYSHKSVWEWLTTRQELPI